MRPEVIRAERGELGNAKVENFYFKHLDGIRTIAVLMVIVHHWYKGSTFGYLHLGGAMGVGLFFVLSGFLITNILLKQQADFQSGNGLRRFTILKTFYIRRTLRIFPIYYIYVFALVVFGIGEARDIWPWLFGYAYNILLFLTNNWHSGYVEHLWSLAIEEQYYLVWPALLLFCPRRWNFTLVIGFIGLGVATKSFLYLQAPASQFSKFPLCQFDAFGFGSALALLRLKNVKIQFPIIWFLALWALAFFFKFNVFHFYGKSFIGQVVPFYYAGCAVLIYMAVRGIKGPMAWFFNLRIVNFLGKISYGLYLYHLFIPDLTIHIFYHLGLPRFHIWWMYLIYSALTLIVCLLSWYGIEQPINRLKDRFVYVRRE